ncbi:hypothetical protein GCM10010357_00960 [Streptomyces luteireticuli]|uniref:Uncharacterized protein n=1 Tax=Streptomyces luteireticuli TaxID=173858 RepID=A0ABN0Y6P0_9ACTN
MQVEAERALPGTLEGVRGQRPVLGHGLTIGQYGRHEPIVRYAEGWGVPDGSVRALRRPPVWCIARRSITRVLGVLG